MAVKKENERKERLIRPRCRVREEKSGDISLCVEMPGVKKDDLTIHVENGVLSISAKREGPEWKGRYLINERPFGTYTQSYTLDETIDPDKIEAKLDLGILTLVLKRKEAAKPRKISISTT